jgi:hypothetical protein
MVALALGGGLVLDGCGTAAYAWLGLHRTEVTEQPPAQYAAGPTVSRDTWQLELRSADDVARYCLRLLGPLAREWRPGRYYMGCYDVRLDAVVVPTKGAWPSEREREAIIAHEWAHARGWRHNDDGRGTSPQSLPGPAATPTN